MITFFELVNDKVDVLILPEGLPEGDPNGLQQWDVDMHINEARAPEFVSEHTSIPVPKVLAVYT
jgi:hypothetical protein